MTMVQRLIRAACELVISLEMALLIPLLQFRRGLILRLLDRPAWLERFLWALGRHEHALTCLSEDSRILQRLMEKDQLATRFLQSPALLAHAAAHPELIEGWLRLPDLREMSGYKDRHRGSRIFILGNGPSVRYADLERLEGEVVFAANRFHLAYEKLRFRPTYTCSMDLGMLETHGAAMAELCGTPYFVPHTFWKQAADWSRSPNVLPFVQHDFYEEPVLFRPEPLTGIGNGDSVIFAAMQLAVWMGANRLVLYGLDHSLKMPADFAAQDKPVTHGGEQNHFLPNYRAPGERWWPPRTERIEAAFTAARLFGEANGIEIVNCTRGGKLEIFQRRDFDEEMA